MRCPIGLNLTFALLAGLLMVAGCSHIERARPKPKASSSVTALDGLQTPSILRGTVGAETMIQGWNETTSPDYQPIIVRGYGFVVGLDGTGSRDVPPDVRAHMIQIMTRQGVGMAALGADGVSPEELLDSPDTAVVIVEGFVPPGAVGRTRTPPVASGRPAEVMPGTTFDVRVHADPRTGTSSLEGGRLYTTDLHPGPLLAGSRQARVLAQASGPIFLNPYTDDAAASSGVMDLRNGRILNGGQVTEDMPIKLTLMTPSYTRVRVIQDAINRRYPIERGQRTPTARGVSDGIIEITVPPSMRDDPDAFVHTLKHVTIRQVDPDRIADSTRKALQRDPSAAASAYWRWVALGPASMPAIRQLYDYPEQAPRLAAIRAGSALEDPIVAEPLRAMATSEILAERLEAASLLAQLPLDPRTEQTIEALLEDDDIEVRMRAYEALEQRGSPLIRRTRFPGKFTLHEVQSSFPALYITQTDEPRLVVFGGDVQIKRPIAAGIWDNRLMIRDKSDEDLLEVYYRDEKFGDHPFVVESSPTVRDLIVLLAHRTSPKDPTPGFDLSYSEVVGATHALWDRQFIAADFKAQQDRALAQARRAGSMQPYVTRPEFDTAADAAAP